MAFYIDVNHSLTSTLTYTHTLGLHLLHEVRSHIKNSIASQTPGFFVTFVAIQDSGFITAPATVGLRTQTWSLATAGAVCYLGGIQGPCCHHNHSLSEWPALLPRAKPTQIPGLVFWSSCQGICADLYGHCHSMG